VTVVVDERVVEVVVTVSVVVDVRVVVVVVTVKVVVEDVVVRVTVVVDLVLVNVVVVGGKQTTNSSSPPLHCAFSTDKQEGKSEQAVHPGSSVGQGENGPFAKTTVPGTVFPGLPQA